MNKTLPKEQIDVIDIPGPEEPKNPCDFFRFFNKSFIENPQGKISIDVNIGLNDMCLLIQFANFGHFDNVLPQLYTCKKHDFLDNESPDVIRKLYHKGDSSVKLFKKDGAGM